MDNLKDIMKRRLSEIFKGETQELIAKKLGTTQSNVSKWVNGQQIPSPDMIYDISKAYKVSADWLLGISDHKEIDGVVLEKLTYEQVAKIIDRLIEMGTIKIPNLQELIDANAIDVNYIESGEEEEHPPRDPIFDSDYIKVNDRALSHILRRRIKIYEIGVDMKDVWKVQSLERYHGLRLLDYTGNMEAAIDTKSWSAFTSDGDWVALIQELGSMTEEERTAMIERAKKNEKDGNHNG